MYVFKDKDYIYIILEKYIVL